MLIERQYKPTENEILYHYCSPETFLAVCTNKTIRFSDIYSMNDFMEMHWGYHRWKRVARDSVERLGKEFIDSIDQIISSSSSFLMHPLAACFSLNGDTLSQWRAYAENGSGFCIGFKADALRLAVRPLRVLYNAEQQEREIELFLSALSQVHKEKSERIEDFFEECVTFSCDLAALKNPSFAEEQEVRLIHLAHVVKSNRSLKLEDPGGRSFGSRLEPQPIKFSMRGSVPVPHLDLSYVDLDGNHPITEIILGPRNDALPKAISLFLETIGLGNIEIKKSHASYR